MKTKNPVLVRMAGESLRGVRNIEKSMFAVCLIMACVLSFTSCDNDDDADSSTAFLSVVKTTTDIFSVEINVKFNSDNLLILDPNSPMPSEFGILATIDGTPSMDDYKYRISTRHLNDDNITYIVSIDNMLSNTTYNCVPYLKAGDNYLYGEVTKFKTKAADISMKASVDYISALSVKLKYDCKGKNLADIDSYGVFYSENVDYVSNVDSLGLAKSLSINSSKINDSVKVKGLLPNTTYYLASYAKAGSEYFLSEVKSFITKNLVLQSGAVDLGLSVKWASCNLGATTPEEFGSYYAWGETAASTGSSNYNWKKPYSELQSLGVIASDGNLTAEYDAASRNLGGQWRMPTDAEISELCQNCEWNRYTLNNVEGFMVMGPNGNYIFLPTAGMLIDKFPYSAGAGYSGYYWGATADQDAISEQEVSVYSSFGLYMESEYLNLYKYDDRSTGLTIRPVTD